MRELIDRQRTLDALDERFESLVRRFDYDSYENADEKTKLVCDGLSEAEDVVMGMPPAQHEIVRCKDCKYNYGLTHGGEFNPDDIVCTYFDTDGMRYCDFCSYAERREDG